MISTDRIEKQVPLARRAQAFRMNDEGWSEQTRNLELHVARP